MIHGDPLGLLPDDKIRHVYSAFGRGHTTDAREGCWCHPEVKFVTEERAQNDYEIIGAIIVHNLEN